MEGEARGHGGEAGGDVLRTHEVPHGIAHREALPVGGGVEIDREPVGHGVFAAVHGPAHEEGHGLRFTDERGLPFPRLPALGDLRKTQADHDFPAAELLLFGAEDLPLPPEDRFHPAGADAGELLPDLRERHAEAGEGLDEREHANLPSYGAHVPVLLLLGGSVGTLDVAINLNAVLVERACGERIMSGMHAFYCMGNFLAAGCYSFLAEAGGLSVPWIAAFHAGAILLLLLLYSRHYLDYHADGSGKKTALPRGIVVFLSVLCCISFLAEGGVMDWGGVLLSEDKGIPLAQAGLGLTAFSVAEFLARLPGDRLVHRFGEKKVILASTVSAAVCFAAVGWAETLPPLIVFFFLLGLSVANVVPVLYSLLEYQTVMPINLAVAALTSMGYAGILLGPAFLGFVAHHTHIAVVFDFLAALVLCQTALALYIFARMRK